MSLLTRAGDLVYTFRFLKLLVTPFEKTKAFEMGLIDKDGKKLRKPKDGKEKSVYTYFHRLVYNIKKLIPGQRLGSYAAMLYLIKEHLHMSEDQLLEVVKKSGLELTDFLAESNMWFVLEDKMMSPGVYKIKGSKVLNSTAEEVVRKNDKITVAENSYPVGDVFGIDIYEVTHINTNQAIYVTAGELIK